MPAASLAWPDDLLAEAFPPGPAPMDGPVETLADLYFTARMNASLATNLTQSTADRHRAATASAEAYQRYESRLRALGGEWVVFEAPMFFLVRWDEKAGGLQYARPRRAGHVVVARPAMAVAG